MEGIKSQQPANLKAKFEAQDVFRLAIKTGRLSKDPKADNYAGHYMYMGIANDGVRDAFKHSLTRQYIA